MVPEADPMMIEVRIELAGKIAELAGFLRAGYKIWGGGAGARACKPFGRTQCYIVEHVTELGEDWFDDSFDIGEEERAVWCYLQRVGGTVTVNIEEDP